MIFFKPKSADFRLYQIMKYLFAILIAVSLLIACIKPAVEPTYSKSNGYNFAASQLQLLLLHHHPYGDGADGPISGLLVLKLLEEIAKKKESDQSN